MEIKTYPMKVVEGKVYAEVTLRDVVEHTKDLSDTPILAEIKRLYDENDKLRELTRHLFWWDSDSRYAKGCQECPTKTDCNGETCIFWDVLRDRARELGIEVD